MQIQNILNYLEASAASCPEKAAFEDLEHSYTFAQVLENAKRIGSALLQVLPQNAPVPVLMEKEASRLYGEIADAQFGLEELSGVLGQE